MAGYAMLNPDGSLRWDLRGSGLSLGRGHLDCARVFRRGATPEEFRIIVTLCGDHGVAMLDGCGKVLWSITGHHSESIVIAQTRAMFDGSGKKMATFDVPWTRGTEMQSYRGDMTGDGIPDVVFHTDPGQEVYIFRNDKGRKIPDSPLGTGLNVTLY